MGTKLESSRTRPPSFFKVMFGDFSRRLGIPPAFVKHFDGVFGQEFVLRTCIGRESHVKIKEVEEKIFFNKGWRLFVQANSIEFGDFLVFSYDGAFEFNVSIYKRRTCCEDEGMTEVMIEGTKKRRKVIYVDDSHCTSVETAMSDPHDRFRCKDFQQGKFKQPLYEEAKVKCMKQTFSSSKLMKSMRGKTSAVEAADKFISKLPLFKVVMWPSYIHNGYMNIPANFHNQYMNKVLHTAMLHVSNRSWHVKVYAIENRRNVRFTEGWNAFVRDNAVQEGDVCVFELINGDKVVLEVSIFGCIG